MLGKDVSEVDKERWENESKNLEYGISYMKSLVKNDNLDLAVSVGEELLLYHEKDKRLLQLISDVYINNYDDNAAIKYLEKLMIIDSFNNEYMIKLSNVYLNLFDFKHAYFWANKSINTKCVSVPFVTTLYPNSINLFANDLALFII